jgi:5-dehydro-4-deoxyglucarate dehydratase
MYERHLHTETAWTRTPPADTVERLRDGMAQDVLSFPLTSFHADGSLDLDGFRTYLAGQLVTNPGALFPACGTGEFSALDEDEYGQVVAAAVEVAAGRVPVIAGTGYGYAQALRFAHIAEDAGADALLVLPHYLNKAPRTAWSSNSAGSPKAPDCPSSPTSATT